MSEWRLRAKPLYSVRRDPVFVIGYPRSGTTMLRLIINRHPDVCIPKEADTFEQLPNLLGSKVYDRSDLEELMSIARRSPLHDSIDFDFLEQLLDRNLPMQAPAIIACLYQACAEPPKQGSRWGDKKPQKVWQFIYKLKDWYPEAQFVHIVRDPRDVIASLDKYIHRGVVFFSIQRSFLWKVIPSHVLIAWQWQYAFDHVAKQGRKLASAPGGSRYIRVQYERLVDEPARSVGALCEFLELDDRYVEDMLRFQEDAKNPKIGQPGEIFMGETKKAINKDQIGKFESRLGRREIADIEFISRRARREMGYGDVAPAPSFARRIALASLCMSLSLFWKAKRISQRMRGHL